MSDLVKRLREAIHAWGTDGLTPVFSEAADRIEELERKIKASKREIADLNAALLEEIAARKRVSVARREALEEAARVCDARYIGDNNREDMEARRCAASIRALMEKCDDV